MHLNETRVTVAFHNVGAFTYELREANSLSEVQNWNGVQNKRPFGCQMRLKDQGKNTGRGIDIDGAEFDLSLKMNQDEEF